MEEEKIIPAEGCAQDCGACDSCAEEMITVVDICFRENGKVYYFDPAGLALHAGDHVMIDTARGKEYGICTSAPHKLPVRCAVLPLRKVLRLADVTDEKTHAENVKKEEEAYEVCRQKIAQRGLDMQLVSAECAFDGSKILFFFTAEERVDFRELVKDLASAFRTRIELRQIGVRDKAKLVGGLGICGRPFCCKQFLEDFEPVSIKMAKTQNLSLNPTKISGTCGRLMCCLKYEQEAYEDLIKSVPKAESFVDTPDGRGTVTDINLLKQSVRVRMEKTPEEVGTYSVKDIYVIRNGKAKKTDPPIPEDFAPISSKPRKPRMTFEQELAPEVKLIGEEKARAEQAEEQPRENRDAEQPASAPKQEKQNRSRRRGRRHRGGKSDAAQGKEPS